MVDDRRCAVLVWDRSAEGVLFRPCGAKSTQVILIGGDMLFRACSRHNKRFDRIGIKSA